MTAGFWSSAAMRSGHTQSTELERVGKKGGRGDGDNEESEMAINGIVAKGLQSCQPGY